MWDSETEITTRDIGFTEVEGTYIYKRLASAREGERPDESRLRICILDKLMNEFAETIEDCLW